MVVVPSGSFLMGSRMYESERPVHRVTFARPFAVGVYEVTFAEWDACVSGGGCGGYRPGDEGWGRGRRPVINVNWHDAKAHVRWLSRETGAEYRLLSESEWEYVARAGTWTRYWRGNEIGQNRANCASWSVPFCGDRCADQTAPMGSFSANALHSNGLAFEILNGRRPTPIRRRGAPAAGPFRDPYALSASCPIQRPARRSIRPT